MFDTIKRIREKNAQLFCGSAIVLALSISGCTTTGTSVLESVANDTTLAENTTSENDQSDTQSVAQSGQAIQTTEQNAQAAAQAPVPSATTADGTVIPLPVTATTENSAQQEPAQTAIAATNQVLQDVQAEPVPEQPATLVALFSTRTKPTAALAEQAATAQIKPQEDATPAQARTQTQAPTPATPPATDRTSQSAGVAARLFSSGTTTRNSAGNKKEASLSATAGSGRAGDYNYALPGVRANGGFEIRHRNKAFNEDDIDLDEDDFGATVTLASAGGMARLAPNGLRTQHAKVQVSCLKPQLVSMIKRLEKHYRKPVIITSGYRSPKHNRAARGAKRSLHMSCSAADLQIPGVSKWEIARHVRSWPSRGGVGTYCHTKSVHIDIGPERDWNWRCRRR